MCDAELEEWEKHIAEVNRRCLDVLTEMGKDTSWSPREFRELLTKHGLMVRLRPTFGEPLP